MKIPRWVNLNVSRVLLALGSVLLCQEAGAATLCTDLPPSILRVYDLKAPAVEAMVVPAAELAGRGTAGDLVSRHTLMVTESELVAWFTIEHQLVPRDDGLVCDAPSVVRMGFGATGRRAFLARAAAANSCVREEMLNHEASHTQALNEAVKRFINQHESDFRRGMVALKATPAPNSETAISRWEIGLQAIVTESKRQLSGEIRAANAHIDEPPALTKLENACGGKIRQLEDRHS